MVALKKYNHGCLLQPSFFSLESKVKCEDLREGVISGGYKYDNQVSSAKEILPLIL